MIKVVTYFKTKGTEKFKDFLSTPFNFNILGKSNQTDDTQVVFNGWTVKKHSTCTFYSNGEVTLEIFETYYNIRKVGSIIKLYLPETINDFINTMYLHEIDIFWEDWIDIVYEPKDYLAQGDIEQYYADLLNRMNKGFELNTKNNG